VTNSIFTMASDREAKFETELTAEIVSALRERGLDEPQALAERIGTIPSTARRLLADHRWPLDIALRVIEKVDLPIDVTFKRSA
jgi:hypothetical protein